VDLKLTMVAVGLVSTARCHSVDYTHLPARPSVIRRYSIKTAKCITTLFHCRVATHHSFFVPNGMAILRRGPLKGGLNARGMNDFRPISYFISEMIHRTR